MCLLGTNVPGVPSTPTSLQSGCVEVWGAWPHTVAVPSPGILPSLCSSCCLQHWTLLSMSLLNCLLSTTCSVGLALAIALTIHSRGMHLVTGCNSSALPADARAAIATNDCPFNTTRIYVSLQGHPPLLSLLLLLLLSPPSLLPTLSLPFFLLLFLPFPFFLSPSLPYCLHSLCSAACR